MIINFKKIIKIALSVCLALLLLLYSIFVFIFPLIINNKKVQINILNLIKQKTGHDFVVDNLNYKTSLNLKSTLKIKNISNEFLKIENLKAEVFVLKPLDINADYVLFDYTKFNPASKKDGKKKSIFKFPKILIKKADLVINDYLKLKFNNISYLNNKINFTTYIRKSSINVDGNYFSNTNYKIKVFAKDILAKDVRDIFANTMKKIKPDEKNFIENFEDFKGFCDIDLNFENKKITGTATLKEFETRFIKFPVPMHFKNAIFYFKGNKVDLKEKGTFGGKPLYTEFWARNMFQKDKYTGGFLESLTSGNIYKKYVKDADISGYVKLRVDYFIQNQRPEVRYRADIYKNAKVRYKKIDISLKDYKRKIEAKTLKNGNNMELQHYSYSYLKDGLYKDILFGRGLFYKNFPKDKFKLAFIEVETNGYAPISILGFLDKYIKEGGFKGKFNYDGQNKKLIGNLDIINSRYKDFYVQNALIDLNELKGVIKAKGNYLNEPFSAYLNIDNDLENIKIHKLDLYLKKYEIKRQKSNKTKFNRKKIQKTMNSIRKENINIKEANLRLDELKFKNIILNNLALNGYVKNNVAYFNMLDISFAKGKLKAFGLYDIQNNSSNIDFSAQNIDSNESASMIFNLKDNFSGFANAKMNVRTYNNLQYIDADASFSIKDGALTKLGSSEFMIKNFRKGKNPLKFKIQDIINVDIKKMEALKSDIQGQFKVKNEKIYDVEIFNQNKFLSLYLMGGYNIKNQNTTACLFAKYSKDSQKGIKILFIPLSWITKIIFKNENTRQYYKKCIEKIPPIETNSADTEIVLVKLIGNLNNSDSLKVDLKSLR